MCLHLQNELSSFLKCCAVLTMVLRHRADLWCLVSTVYMAAISTGWNVKKSHNKLVINLLAILQLQIFSMLWLYYYCQLLDKITVTDINYRYRWQHTTYIHTLCPVSVDQPSVSYSDDKRWDPKMWTQQTDAVLDGVYLRLPLATVKKNGWQNCAEIILHDAQINWTQKYYDT